MEILGVEIPVSCLLLLASLALLYECLTWTWGTWSRRGIPEVKPWIVVGSRLTVYKGISISRDDFIMTSMGCHFVPCRIQMECPRDDSLLLGYFGGFAFDIIASYGFGVEISSMKDADNPFVKNALRLLSNENVDTPIVLLPMAFPKLMLYMELFPPETNDFFVKLIKEMVEARKEKPDAGTRNDFLGIIIQALKELEENEDYQRLGITQTVLEAQLMLFFLKNSIKNSNSILKNSVVVHVPREPRQERRKKAIRPLGVWLSCNFKNIVIPKDTLIQIPLSALHRDEKEFPEPEAWKPERFLEKKRVHDPYAYLPVGIGPRMCIGERLPQENDPLRLRPRAEGAGDREDGGDPRKKPEYQRGFLFLVQPTDLVVGFRPLR
ncbi:unnamed protein product [Darwinula stevensoni]|uniref:Cytochrome P450 n=1 Tax=Darwinula stevensoni TaxID=69355 RepID=A0A7R9AAY3_9CRUS|nr:unnamed protein product [Darwinula stevensoni]CAG0898847.1 unnamed protein product [Darwinula stevensoni]